jgi:hypothetical protein
MGFPKFTKDPSALLDYAIDWTDWLETTDTISSAVWTVPTGLVLEDQTETEFVASAWLSGGVVGTKYNVACLITTTAGRLDERTFTISIKNK